MVAWYWVLISVVVSNFLTVLLSYKINFENFWEDSLFALFYPFVWVGTFPYVFFRNFFISVTRQQFEEVATGADKKKLFINYLKMSIFGMIKRQRKFIIAGS